MPFRFSLQKVLEYRVMLEDQARVALARAQRLYLEEERRADALEALLAGQETALRSAFLLPAEERWLLELFVRGVREDTREARRRLRTLAEARAKARNALRERAVDKKVLERLRDRQREQYDREERRKEERINDEIATLRFKAASF
jgi:flagellar FliJ protein